jgi:hypothetical protein
MSSLEIASLPLRRRALCAAIGALCFIALTLPAHPTSACSCIAPNHQRDVQRFSVAFLGVAQELRRLDDSTEEVTFSVLQRWNGVPPSQRTVRVLRPLRPSMCPIPSFRARRRYAVYVEARSDGALVVSGCNPSRER